MSNNKQITPATVCFKSFSNVVVDEPRKPKDQKASIMRRIIMVGGVLSGFRKGDDGFYFVDDGHDGGYRLSFADTDYLSHTVHELIRLGYVIPRQPEIMVSNIAFNGSIFDHVEAGERADCLVLANLYWDSRKRPKLSNPRKDQDHRNFDGQAWRRAFDKSEARVLAVIYSEHAKGNYQARWVPNMMREQAGLRLVSQTHFRRTSQFGHSIALNADFFMR